MQREQKKDIHSRNPPCVVGTTSELKMTLGHPDALQPGVSSQEASARKSADFEQLRAEALGRMNTVKRKRTALLTGGTLKRRTT